MKRMTILLLTFFVISCSNNNDGIEIGNAISISNFNFKTFNTTSTPNAVIDSTNFQLDSNKIISYSGKNFQTSLTSNGNYSFTSGKISQISRFKDAVLTSKSKFLYDSQDNLSEYLVQNINSTGTSFYHKSIFTHTLDTVFVERRGSLDGINFNIDIDDSKIVIDNNENRAYFENFDYSNTQKKAIRMEYDSNNNPIKEEFLYDSGSGLEVQYTNIITFDNTFNSFYTVNNETFSRKTLMLLYHFQSNDINSIKVKSISTNNINSFDTTFGNIFSFQFENTIDDNGYSTENIYKALVGTDTFGYFSYDFVFN